jgi:hypothetical protein
LTTAVGACAVEDGDVDTTCEGDQCDETPFQPDCNTLVDRSGRGFLPSTLKDDIMVKTVYHGSTKTCAVTADAIIASLIKANASCKPTTRIISETDVLTGGQIPDHRAVTTLACGGTPNHKVFVSTFGFDVGGRNVPDGVEIATFQSNVDGTPGVINYFKEVGGRMTFFGNSKDYILQGPAGPNLTDVRGCANCHPGGGLVMKELTDPWVHWEPRTPDNGGAKHFATIVRNRATWMGTQIGGEDL